MKQLITGSILFISMGLNAQCRVCYSLEEAKKAPEQVEELHLSNSPLVSIDSSFNQFTSLQVLNLSYSPILEVSDQVSIRSLKTLQLSHASYNPWKIGAIGKAFPNLEQLDLSGNQLSFIWSGLQNLSSLIQLDISDNNLISIPIEVMYLSSLKELNVSKNDVKLQGNELGALWLLEKLDISDNSGLSTHNLILSISESKNLRNLIIDGNVWSAKNSQLLSNMKLERLELNGLKKPTEIDFTRFSSLKNVALTHAPDWLSSENVKHFDQVSKIELTNASIPAELQKLKSLSVLVLNTTDPAQISNLYPLKQLSILDVTHANFSKDQIDQLKLELPSTEIITGTTAVSEKMIANELDPMIQILAKTITLQSGEASTLAEKNVVLAIPENAFLDSKGNGYQGKVTIELTVYDDPIQTALAGIPMSFTTNNQEELFASNGMLKFEATGENQEILQPNPENLIQVSLGNLQPQNPGGLYSFNQQTAQWNTIAPTVNSSNLGAQLQRAIDSINRLDLRKLVPRAYNDRIFAIYPQFSRLDKTEISFFSQYIPTQSNALVVTHNRNNAVGKLITKEKWVIDTIVGKELKKQLKTMKKETKAWHAKKFRNRSSKRFIPRLINRLTIEPDPSHDNYRLNFRYRDTLVSLPLALAGTSNKQIQRNTQRFQARMKQAGASDKKEDQRYQHALEEQLQLAENELRQRLIATETAKINQLLVGGTSRQSPNQLNFGLSIFGLINCDFFQRSSPDFAVFASQTLTDQNGKSHKKPSSIICIDPSMNFYMELEADSKIRCFKSTIVVFKFDSKQLGVSKPKNGKKSISDVFLIDITGKSPEEISQAILSI